MLCPEGTLVQHFVAGRLDDALVGLFEAHIEQCEECFMRLAAAAGDASQDERAAWRAVGQVGSRLERSLATLCATVPPDYELVPSTDVVRTQIGPYVVTGFLGVGGMGIVYRAQHRDTGLQVALKTVKMPLLASSLAMLRQEIDFLRQAQHPGVVAIVDFDLLADEPWYAMELFEGQTLRDFNQRLWTTPDDAAFADPLAMRPAAGGRLADTLRLFSRLCEPIDFVHRGGMVHCDIKPSNVFLRSELEPVLMDFGLVSQARGTVGREALVVTGRLRGSLPYIAPELIRGTIPDTRADLYALGCMLYESVVGTPPFVSASSVEIIDMHLRRPAVPASQLAAGVPAELDALLLRLLAKNPYERFGHATALGAALGGLADALLPSSELRSVGARTPTQPTTLFRPPMVGRRDEFSRLCEGLDKARLTSSGSLFLISGQSGIGKTFFTAEVGQHAALTGMHVITGECQPMVLTADAPADAGSRPLQAFRRFFESLRERCHEHGPTETDQLFGERLPVLCSSLPVLRNLLGDAMPFEPPPALPAGAARERIVSAVVDTLVAYASRGPLLLAIDDLHWADDLSLAVLDRLDDAILGKLPLVIVANFRSEEAGETVRRIARKSSTRELALGGLGAAELRALVGGMLSMPTPPESLVGYIDAHSEGIPFFAAEYLRSLVAAGALVYDVGTWSTDTAKLDAFRASRGGELPRTLHDLIRGRLERLARDSVALLEAGAVVGRRFSVSVLGRMLGERSERWAPLLEAAVTMQVTNSEDAETYTFLHDKIREALYASLPEPRRTELHLAAARALEDSNSSPDEYAPIAHHYRQGGELFQAIDYLEKAGSHALSIAANADAVRFFGEALDLEATLSQRLPGLRRARWLRQRGDALGGLGRMAESASALKASAALLGRPFPRSTPDFAAKLAREVVTQVWHRLRPRSHPLEGRRAEVDLEVMRVFERMHEVSFYLGRDADLLLSTTVSLNSSERVGATPSLAIAYSNAAMLAGVLPMPALADHYFRLAAAAVRAAPDVSAESWVFEMEGSYRVWQGRRDEAFASMGRAIQLARQGGHSRRCDEAECVLIGLDLLAGFHAQALARAAQVLPSARKRNDVQIQAWLTLDRAEAQLLRDDLPAAFEALRSVEAWLPFLGRPERIWATGTEAYIRHRRGDEREARVCLERGLGLILSGQPIHGSCLGAYDRLAEMAVEIFGRERASGAARTQRQQAEKLCSILQRVASVFPISRPAAALHRGALDLLVERRSTSRVLAQWRRAADLARELELPYQELRLRRAIVGLAASSVSNRRDEERSAELQIRLEQASRDDQSGASAQSAA